MMSAAQMDRSDRTVVPKGRAHPVDLDRRSAKWPSLARWTTWRVQTTAHTWRWIWRRTLPGGRWSLRVLHAVAYSGSTATASERSLRARTRSELVADDVPSATDR